VAGRGESEHETSLLPIAIGSVVFDCADPLALMTFWQEVTGFQVRSEGPDWCMLKDPAGIAPKLAFQRVPEAKVVKNRVHLDLFTPDERAHAARIEALGAKRLWISDDPEDPFIVLGDPEGNEFCVVRVRKESPAPGANQKNGEG